MASQRGKPDYAQAFQLIFDYSLDMVAWAAGLIAFSGGFLMDPNTISQFRSLLQLLLMAYAVSVVAGLFVLSRLIGIKMLPQGATGDMPTSIRIAASIQFTCFFVGVMFSFWLGFAKTLD